MFGKVGVYYSSGGVREVFRYIFTYLRKHFFYISRTVYLCRDIRKTPVIPYNGRFEFRVIYSSDALESLKFRRVEALQYRQWFSKASYVVVGFVDCRPVSFSWCHFRFHEVDHNAVVDLGDSAVWIGPTFVDKSMRGKGMNKAQIAYQIGTLPSGIEVCLTSANANNIASIRSFEKLRFHRGALSVQHQGMFSNKGSKIEFFNGSDSLLRFIDNV